MDKNWIGRRDTADEAWEYVIDGVLLRDIITEVTVYDRTV
jgi:hypothetical protein